MYNYHYLFGVVSIATVKATFQRLAKLHKLKLDPSSHDIQSGERTHLLYTERGAVLLKYKKAVQLQGNRAMPQPFFSV